VRAPLSVVLIVKNEQDRLPEALESVDFADEIVVADTGSTDETARVARLGGARVVSIGWEGFVASRNRALLEARHDWVLVLDADERVSPALCDEILAALERDDPAISGYRMPRLSHFLGRAIHHGTWYPDYKLRLGRRSRSLRAEGGRVHEVMVVDGATERLATLLIHHPYRDLSDALRKASTYARLGAHDRFDRGARGSAAGLFLRPAFEFFRCLVLRAGFRDGLVGFYVAFLHASSYFLRAAFLLEFQRRHPVERSGRQKEIPT
jgi:glycosyltransferase involved in cell wall biosynthesis